jgi:hypothetical protein
MRQRLLMFLKPNPIAHVDIAAADRAFPEALGLAQRARGDLPTDDGAARKWIFHARDFHLMSDQKNQAPELLPRPDLYGARFTSDRVAISFYIATSDADVKLPRAAHPVVQRTISASAFDVRHSASDCQGTGVLVSWLKRRMLE